MLPLVFVSYSHKDEEWKNRVVDHLRVVARQVGDVDVWDDRKIGAGTNWRQKIDEALSGAHVAVLIVSTDFLVSDFIWNVEVQTILGRRMTEGLRVVPVIAKPCSWQSEKWLAELLCLPKDGRPLLGMEEAQQEEAMVAIAQVVRSMLTPPPSERREASLGEQPEIRDVPGRTPQPTREAFEVQLARAIRRPGLQEFELLDRHWQDYTRSLPISTDRLVSHCTAVLRETTIYPWTIRSLREAGFRDLDITRLCRSGLLRPVGQRGTVEIAKPRLLPWAVAAGLVSAWRSGEIDRDFLVQQGLACLAPVTKRGQPWLGDAVLDLLWQLSADDESLEATTALLAALEGHHSGEKTVRLVWQLGVRILPAVFARLGASATSEDSWSIRYLDVLREMSRVAGQEEIAGQALALVREADTAHWEIGIPMLRFAPTAAALDRLWQIRTELQDEHSLPLQAELGHALAACAQRRPGWVDLRLLACDPSREPVEELVFLLLHVDVGGEIWQRLRDSTIMPKAAGRGDRALAYCAFQYRDRSMVQWLRDHVAHTQDYVGPAALRALLSLDPEADPPTVHGEALDSLVLLRGWWLLLYLISAESRAQDWVLGLLRSHPNPWWIATMYSDLETWMSEAVVEEMLTQAAQLLAAETANPTDGRTLWRPLQILATVHRRDLLRRFERRRNSRFESELAECLIRLGLNDTDDTRGPDKDGCAVLLKIGGQGYARVASAYLQQARTRHGQRLAIELAVRGVLEDGMKVLADWVALPEGEPPPPTNREDLYARSQALRVLAVAGNFRAVVEGVVKFGLMVPGDLDRYLEGVQFSDSDLALAQCRFAGAQTPPGAVFAIGLGHRSDLTAEVRAILKMPDIPSDLAIAGLLALALLADESPEAEEIFLAYLPKVETRYAASRALLQLSHRPMVKEALLADLVTLGRETPATKFDSLPADLLEMPEIRTEAARILWDHNSTLRRLFFVGDLAEHFSVLGEEAKPLLRQIADGEVPRLTEGSRISAIKGLELLDPSVAFEAAVELLAEPVSNSRWQAPRLLLRIDFARAVPLLNSTLSDFGSA